MYEVSDSVVICSLLIELTKMWAMPTAFSYWVVAFPPRIKIRGYDLNHAYGIKMR